MAIESSADFLAILEKSRLVSADSLEKIRAATAEAADAKAVAKLLIQRGVLTRFQAMQLLAGRHALLMGSFRLMDRILTSGTGAVYAAQSVKNKQPVTLKILPRKLIEKKEVAATLQQHLEKLKSLDHPGVCRVVAVHAEGNQTLLQMDVAQGNSLAARVAKDGPLSFEAAGSFVRQAADALAAAHESGVVHGDLTPQHLICDAEDHLMVVDFGTAALNPSGVTADFAAPESSAETPPSAPGDIYSLGCTLYFLLTGKPPFPEGTAEEKRRQHQEDMPAAVLEVRSDAPPEIMKLCIRMMAKDPEKRLESAVAVVAAVDEWLAAQSGIGASTEEGEDEMTESSDEDLTDPDVDRALAEAMAASNFDDNLDEPPPEVTPDAEAPTKAEAPADATDDILAQAMAASEFDHEIEDEEKADKRKARLGGVAEMSSGKDELLDELTVAEQQPEEETDKTKEGEADDTALGPKVFGLDVYRLIGIKEDDDDAAKKKKVIRASAVGGGVLVVLLLCALFVWPGFLTGKAKKGPRRSPQVAQNTPQQNGDAGQQQPGGSETPAGDNGETTDPDGGDGSETTDGGTTTNGETDDGTPDAATDDPVNENGNTTDVGTETQPGDGATTGTDTGTGTDTVEPTDVEPTEQGDPFKDLSAHVDLSRARTSGELSLGRVDLAPNAECTLQIIGAKEAGVGPFTFELSYRGESERGRFWHILATMAGASEPEVLGGIYLREGEVFFQWNPAKAMGESAKALPRTALKVQSGTKHGIVALGTPLSEKPVTVQFNRESMKEFFELNWKGDPQLLSVEITSLEGTFPKHEFKDGKNVIKGAADNTVMFLGEGTPPMLAVKVESLLTDKLALTLSPFFRLESEQKTLPFSASSTRLWGNKLLKSKQDETESLETARKREQDARGTQAQKLREIIAETEAKIATIDASLEHMKKLSNFAVATHDKGKVHFRVFYKLGDREIDIVRTE